MIPIRHTLPRRTTPIVNRTIVALNIAIFIAMLFLGQQTEALINTFGFIPRRAMSPAAALTLVTSLFLHGGFVHLFGNMIYLWVFGGPVEDAFGHLRYLLFYIACGVVGSLVHTM